MPWKSATKIELSEKQKRILTGFAAGTHTPLHLKTRARIVLNAAKGWGNNTIEKNMHLDPTTVKRWRDRYSMRYDELKRIEAEIPFWTPGTLQREAIQRGIVETISVRHVGRFLKRKRLTAS